MRDPEPDSPFAECAEPKLTAVQYLKARREADARIWSEQSTLWGSLLVGCSALATLGAGLAAGAGVLLRAAPLAVGGGMAGFAGGLLAGWISWATLQFKAGQAGLSQARTPSSGWSAGAAYSAFWAGVGIVAGAGMGASEGIVWSGVETDSLPWTMGGSALGGIAAFFAWLPIALHPRPQAHAPLPSGDASSPSSGLARRPEHRG